MFQFQIKILNLISFVLLMVYLPNIKSDCVIQYSNKDNTDDTLPKYEKSIGKYKIRVPYNGNPIKLYNGETLHGLCDTYFNTINYQIKEKTSYDSYYGRYREEIVNKSISNKTSIALNCRNNKLFYDNLELTQNTFSCIRREWSIYSTKRPYSWCENIQNSGTFLLITKPTTDNFVLAAICYNMEQISLQTVVYNVTNLRRNYLNRPMDIKTTTNKIPSEYLDENLWNFKTTTLSDLSDTLFKEKLTDLANTDTWLKLANYEVSSIVQDEILNKYFKEYDNILNIIWWRNLRLGNWQRFLNTLTNYAYNNFEIYTGISGVAQYPTDDKCHKEKFLEMELGFKNETIPAYIWTYLKSNDNLNKEFIIVGYNSPYSDYFTTDKIIFCPDICAEISWLNEIYPSFRYAYAGIMFCCSTDFIRQTNYLQGFPIDILPTSYLTTTTTQESTTLLDLEEETTFLDWEPTVY